MKCRALALVLAVAVTGLAPLIARAEAMRCGQALVKDDSPIALVQSTCGAPSTASQRIEHRSWPVVAKNGSAVVITQDVVIDQWTYDFGPTEFVYHLTFEDGKMVKMTRGTWGTPR